MRRKMRLQSIVMLIFSIGLIWTSVVFGGSSKVIADSTDKRFEIDVRFSAYDNSTATLSNDQKMMKFAVVDSSGNFKSTTYSYTWSDGESVQNAQTDGDGSIVLTHTGTTPVSSVNIQIDNVEPDDIIVGKEFDYASFWVGYASLYSGNSIRIDPLVTYVYDANLYFKASSSPQYKATMVLFPVIDVFTIDVSWEHYTDGSPMTLSCGDIIPLSISNKTDTGAYTDCIYKLTTDQGYEFTSSISASNGISFFEASDHLEGVKKITVTLYAAAPFVEIAPSPNASELWTISDISIDGTKTGLKSTTLTPGNDPIEVVCTEPRIYKEGKISFDTVDGTIPADTVMNFSFDLMKHPGNNFDLNNFYWTSDSDPSVKHYADKKENFGGWSSSHTGSTNYTYYVTIPLGESITLHNMAPSAMWRQVGAFSYYGLESDASYSDGTNDTWVKINGQNSDWQTAEENGYIRGVFNVPMNGVNDSPTAEIQTSGYFYNLGYLSSGYEMRFYLLHQSEQFMFHKEYDPDDATSEPDRIHDFEVTLKDASGNPYTNKVAYYICDDLDTVIDEDQDVLYATPDSDGKFTIGLKAGQYVKLGRSINDSVLDYHLRLGQGWPDQVMIKRVSLLENGCFPELGMLPYGIEYEIREVETNYTCQAIGSTSGTLDSKNGNSFYDLRTGHTLADFKALMEQDSSLPTTTFVNTRKTGSLKISKKVTGLDNGKKEFVMEVEFRDSGKSFPGTLSCVKNDGSTTSLTVTEKSSGVYTTEITIKDGESLEITGIPSGATYKVKERDSSADGFTVSYENDEGEINSSAASVSVTNQGPTPTSTPTPTTAPEATPTPASEATPTPVPMTTETPKDTSGSQNTPTPTTSNTKVVKTGENGNGHVRFAILAFAISLILIGRITEESRRRSERTGNKK